MIGAGVPHDMLCGDPVLRAVIEIHAVRVLRAAHGSVELPGIGIHRKAVSLGAVAEIADLLHSARSDVAGGNMRGVAEKIERALVCVIAEKGGGHIAPCRRLHLRKRLHLEIAVCVNGEILFGRRCGRG